MKKIRVASVQFAHAPGDKEANLGYIRRFVKEASARGVELVVFPECCISGYWHLRHLSREELVSLAEPVPDGPSTQELLKLARAHGMTVGAGLVESADDGAKLYNAYVVAMPDGEIRRHRKLHCFISEHLGSGAEYTVFDTPQDARVGVLTCYDCNIIENARIAALMGRRYSSLPTRPAAAPSRRPTRWVWWTGRCGTTGRRTPGPSRRSSGGRRVGDGSCGGSPAARTITGCSSSSGNGVGPDDDEIRTGNAMIIDPFGRILAETCYAGDDMVTADLDPSLFEGNTGRRWIRTRRPELYGMLCRPTGREEDTRRVRFEA